MASSHQQAEWLRAGVIAATVINPHLKRPISPLAVIPPQYRPKLSDAPPPDRRSKEQIESDSRRGWNIWFHALGKQAGKRRKRFRKTEGAE